MTTPIVREIPPLRLTFAGFAIHARRGDIIVVRFYA